MSRVIRVALVTFAVVLAVLGVVTASTEEVRGREAAQTKIDEGRSLTQPTSSRGAEGMEYITLDRRHLGGVIRLCEAENWSSYTAVADQTWQALTAPGSHTIVAVEGDVVVGFARVQSDGVVQAHLSLIAVAADQRRRGIGRRLIEEAFRQSGAQRIDLISTEGADDFYRSFSHRSFPGFRIYPRGREG